MSYKDPKEAKKVEDSFRKSFMGGKTREEQEEEKQRALQEEIKRNALQRFIK